MRAGCVSAAVPYGDVAELATHTLDNLLPLRVLRSGRRNAGRTLSTMRSSSSVAMQVMLDQHSWPVWESQRVRATLANFRDLYKYVHDQTLRMMNNGMGPAEIAASLTAPPGLETNCSTRGYYDAIGQDARAVYQRYVGWYDGNPANLIPLPRVEEAKKYLEYIGGGRRSDRGGPEPISTRAIIGGRAGDGPGRVR
jgi:alkyl sulfatase BDS1-like metallo-beta-lactamase superfamily hydrolase